MPHDQRVVTIAFEADGLRLHGTLHLPPIARPPLVIGSHGLFSSSSSPKQIALAEACTRLKLAYLRFDHRGCGSSEGRFDTATSLTARCRDIIRAHEAVREQQSLGRPLGLFGSSMGGTVCLAVASRLTAACLVTYAAPVRSRPIELSLERNGSAASGRNRLSFDIGNRLEAIDRILIIHGEADAVVPLGHAHEIFRAAGPVKKLVVQPGGDHPMSNPRHQSDFIQAASEWFRRHLSGSFRSGA